MDLRNHTARELIRLLTRRELSAQALMHETYQRIQRVNPQVNALVNLLPEEQAMDLARSADQADHRGPLHGLPMAVKDTEDVAGFPTTFGFEPFANRVAAQHGLVAERLTGAGALLIGKTNTPEFALGSHTFNALFGRTLNPYDLDKTPGGSSGGAAAALATGMLALADGSDMGGSLRNPASFCNVVGVRPAIGRVPSITRFGWLGRLSTSGAMARTVQDAALLLSVLSGPDPRDPMSALPATDPAVSSQSVEGLRIAWSADLNGLPIDSEVTAALSSVPQIFRDLGCCIEDACPNLEGAMAVFQIQRAAGLAALGDDLDQQVPHWREVGKDSLLWNVDQGRALTATQLLQSERKRTQIYQQAKQFFDRYDVLLCPAAQVPPFNASLDWIRSINDQPMASYIDWMAACCVVSVTGLPTLSVPGGFTAAGLPVGLQMVGRPHGEQALLQTALAFERATRFYERRPAEF